MIPQPPFHSAAEELLYNIYLKLDMNSLKESDINTLAKLNAIVLDSDLMSSGDVATAINALKGNVPDAGNTLEKLFNIIQGFTYLKADDIDTLAELNAILSDANLIKTEDLQGAITALKGSAPQAGDTLEKIYNLLVPVLSAWVQGGNNVGSEKAIGAKDNFSLPFITNNIERGRFDTNGNLFIGYNSPNDQVVIGAASTNFQLPGNTPNSGFSGYKFHIIKPGGLGLGVSGSSAFRDGDFNISLGEMGNGNVKNSFRLNSYLRGLGGYEFVMSASNINAVIEIADHQFGGTRNEMLRLSPAGYANTAILIRPNDSYNTGYGYRYILHGTNPEQQGRFIGAFHAQLNFSVDDSFAYLNRAQLFTAQAVVTNHFADGFFADVRGTDPNAQVFAYRSVGSRTQFDGTGMTFAIPVVSISTDGSAHAGANASLLNAGNISSAALYIMPMGSERTGIIISPGQAQANGLFIGPQQSLGTFNFDGYLLWLQYSTNGNNMQGGTSKPMLFIRKNNSVLNGFDHAGAFIRLEEHIGSTGPFLEAFKYDNASSSLKLKFSVNKDGVISIGQVSTDPGGIADVGRLYFVGDDLKLVTPSGVVKTVMT